MYLFFDLNLNCVSKAYVSLVCLEFDFKFTSKSLVKIAFNIDHPSMVTLCNCCIFRSSFLSDCDNHYMDPAHASQAPRYMHCRTKKNLQLWPDFHKRSSLTQTTCTLSYRPPTNNVPFTNSGTKKAVYQNSIHFMQWLFRHGPYAL